MREYVKRYILVSVLAGMAIGLIPAYKLGVYQEQTRLHQLFKNSLIEQGYGGYHAKTGYFGMYPVKDVCLQWNATDLMNHLPEVN